MRWRVYGRASRCPCTTLQAEKRYSRYGTAFLLGFFVSPANFPTQIETVTGMFPDLPKFVHPLMKSTHMGEDVTFVFHSANIHYDLLRTGSVELTTNKILERGFLDAVRASLSSLIFTYS